MAFTPSENPITNPTRESYTELRPFRFWCQKVLPLVYDDSLSYYELLCKVVDYLNKTMEDVDHMNTDMDTLYSNFQEFQEGTFRIYNELVDYVNTYFDELDVQEEIDNKLDDMVTSGELVTVLQPTIASEVANWLNDHVTPTTPSIDNTLLIAGAGADARKTGELASYPYNSTRTYKKGEYCLNNGTVYKALVNIDTPEPFTVSHWINTNFGSNIYTDKISAFTGAYEEGASIRNGTIPNSGNANCVVVGVFNLLKLSDYMMFNLITDRPVDEGYTYYFNYALCNHPTGEPEYSSDLYIVGNIDTSTRELNVPFVLNVVPEYSGVMFCIGQRNSNGEFSPLRKEDFLNYTFRLETYGDHYTYNVRNGSFGNPANGNQITAGVFPVKENTDITLFFDKPLESPTNKYCIGYRFISNVSVSKDLNYRDYGSNIIASADASATSRQINTILRVPSGAVGLILTIGEYTENNNPVSISAVSAEKYNIGIKELDYTPVRNGSYLNSGNTTVVTTPWYAVSEGEIVKLFTDRQVVDGYYYRIGYVISSVYSSGYELDMNPLVNIAYDRELPILTYNEKVIIPKNSKGICFIISQYNGSDYAPLRYTDFIHYNVNITKTNLSYPYYWTDAINTAEESINNYCKEGHNVSSFAFITDTHYGANKKHSVMLLNEIMSRCHIPVLLHGGDAVTGSGADTPKQDLFDSMMDDFLYFKDMEYPILKITGNHELAYGMTNYEDNITSEELYNYYFRHNEKDDSIVFGDDNSYFYKDVKAQKIRYICLNIVDYASQINSSGYVVGANKLTQFMLGNAQLNWLIDALNVPDEDYNVVILTHCPMVEDSRFTSIDPTWIEHAPVDLAIFTGIIEAYKNKTTYSNNSSITLGSLTENYNINCNFNNYEGDLICCVSGHTHHDIMFNINGINHVSTANDSSTVSTEAPTYVPPKTMLSDTEQIIDVFCLNKNTKHGYVVRLGASTTIYGKIREFTW